MNKIHYCPIGQVQRQFGIYVTGAGKEVTKPGEPYPHDYHSSDYYFTWKNGRTLADWEYQLLYIRDGKGVIEFKRGNGLFLQFVFRHNVNLILALAIPPASNARKRAPLSVTAITVMAITIFIGAHCTKHQAAESMVPRYKTRRSQMSRIVPYSHHSRTAKTP